MVYLDKHVKSKKRACAVFIHTYIVLVKGKLAKNTSMGLFFSFVLKPKKHHLYSCADVGMSTPAKQAYADTGIQYAKR